MDGNWASRATCRNCWEPAPQSIVEAARAEAKRCGKGRVGNKSKGYDLAGFKRQLLAEVRSTIKDGCATSSEPASGRGSTVETHDGDRNGNEEQGTAARRERLGTEIQELRKVLGPDHVEVTKRCAELENLRQQRPLHTRVLGGQRRVEKATKKVEMRRKELAEAEELLRMAHEKRDNAFREWEAAQEEVLHAWEGQAELVGRVPWSRLSAGTRRTVSVGCSACAGLLVPDGPWGRGRDGHEAACGCGQE